MSYLKSRIGNAVSTVFANCLAISFYVLFHSLYNIRLRGVENYTAAPSVLITINHKRDLDVPVVASLLHLHKTVLKDKLRLHFVARDDLFYPGFLTAHFPFFGVVGKLIHRINLAPVMRALRAYPISHLVRNRIGCLMREVMQLNGNVRLTQVVKPSGLEIFDRLLGAHNDKNLGDITVSDFLGYEFCKLHHQPADIGILKDGLPRIVRTKTLTTINQQLKVFARILDEGGICMLAPEGQLSPDGRFWPVKSGLYRLISMTTSNIRVIPVNTTYDFMTRGRMRIYVTIGSELADLRKWKKTDLERRVQQTMVTLGPVTLGQLGSEFLVRTVETDRDIFKESELLAALSARIEELHARGICLEERMLTERSLNKRTRDFLGYCLNKGIVSRDNNGSFHIARNRIVANMSDNWWQNPVQYSANELRSLLERY